MIKPDDIQAIRFWGRLMLVGTIVILILMFGVNYALKSKYPILTNEQRVFGKVTSLAKYQSVLLVQLDDSVRIMIPASRNYDYDPPQLQHLLKTGDVISKKASNDTISLRRGRDSFFFLLGKQINRD